MGYLVRKSEEREEEDGRVPLSVHWLLKVSATVLGGVRGVRGKGSGWSLYRSSLSTSAPGGRGLESGKKAALTSSPRSVSAA